MAQLTAKILNKQSSFEFLFGGRVRETLIVTAYFETTEATPRRYGPLTRTFDRSVPTHEIDAWLDEERRALEPHI